MPGIFDLIANGQSPQQLAQMFRGLGNSRWMQQPSYNFPTILPPGMGTPGAGAGGVPLGGLGNPAPTGGTPAFQSTTPGANSGIPAVANNLLPGVPNTGIPAVVNPGVQDRFPGGAGGHGGVSGGSAGAAGPQGGVGDPNSPMGQAIGSIGSIVGMINPMMGIPMMAANITAMADDNPTTNPIGLEATMMDLLGIETPSLFGGDSQAPQAAVGQGLGDVGFSGTIGQPASVTPNPQLSAMGVNTPVSAPVANRAQLSAMAANLGGGGGGGGGGGSQGNPNASGNAATGGGKGSGINSGTVGAGASPGGSKIICAELHRQGLLDSETFAADEAWGDKVPAFILSGYHLWARPVVSRMIHNRAYAERMAVYARPVAKTLASFMGHGKPSILGLAMLAVGLPVCALLGLLTPCISPSFRQI